jgi:hypothetical protein
MPLVASVTLAALLHTADFSTRTVDAVGRDAVSVSLTGLTNPVLSEFRLRYESGDHQMRSLGARVIDGQARAVFVDASGGDDFSFRARYRGSAAYEPHQTEAECHGPCTIPITRPIKGVAGEPWRLVLVGFAFEVKSNGMDRDRKVRVIALRPSEDGRSYRADFRDKGSFDYTVRLQYAWIRAGFSGTKTDTAQRSAAQRTHALALGRASDGLQHIAGFSAVFDNGEHHLADLAFERDTDGIYYARFNDANYDDPVTVTLDRVWTK